MQVLQGFYGSEVVRGVECSGNIERCSRVFWMLLKVCRRAGLREQDIELAHVLVPVPGLQREERGRPPGGIDQTFLVWV